MQLSRPHLSGFLFSLYRLRKLPYSTESLFISISPSNKLHLQILPHSSNSTGLIFCDACLLDKPSPLFVLIGCSHAVCEQCADSTGFDVCLPPRSASLTCPRCKRRSEVVSMQQQHDKSQPESRPTAPETATIPKRRNGITNSAFILSPGKGGLKTAPGTSPDSSDDDYEII